MDPETVNAPSSFEDLLEADVDGLLDAPEKAKKVTSSDRLERAFLEIVEFRRQHGRIPSSTTPDIAERKLGARLGGILASDEKIEALRALDEFDLLVIQPAPTSIDDLLNSDEFELLEDESGLLDVSDLPTKRVGIPDSVSRRKKAEDFELFEPRFKEKHAQLADGTFKLVPYPGVQTIEPGNFFVLGGVMLLVAEVGETTYRSTSGKNEPRQRMRLVFENGTESDMYRQSLNARLHESDGLALVRTGHDVSEVGDADVESGTVYVLRSLSTDPQIAGIKNLHKIGFTRGSVEDRLRSAENSPTYLMAPVKVVSTIRVYNARPAVLENLIHRVFAEVRLDVSQVDRWGRDYDASEWFVVPLDVIDEVAELIVSGGIVDYVYDAASQRLKRTGA